MDVGRAQITELLRRVRSGDESASDELLPLVYGELHRIAQRHLRKERPGHTLQATALVNEAYLRIFQGSQPQFADRAHFLALASRVMRRVLVDYARRRAAACRQGDEVSLDDRNGVVAVDAEFAAFGVMDLDRAIDALAADHPNIAEAVEMRYFGGMTAEETAEATGRTIHVVQHDLRFAHAWLRRRLAGNGALGPKPADGGQ
jgi:RNA polymerase sigma factor (TIGR02999 family)